MDPIPIVVASVALAGVIINAVVVAWQGKKVRDQAQVLAVESGRQAKDLAEQVDRRETVKASRGDWWGRFNDTVPRLSSPELATRRMAVEVLTELASADWVQPDDRRLTVRVLGIYTERAVGEMSGRGGPDGD